MNSMPNESGKFYHFWVVLLYLPQSHRSDILCPNNHYNYENQSKFGLILTNSLMLMPPLHLLTCALLHFICPALCP